MKSFVVGLVLFCLVGCCPQPESTRTLIQQQEDERSVLQVLPKGSIVEEHLGNRWFVVTTKIDGQDTKFLAHDWYGSHGEHSATLTKLDDK